MLTEIFQDSTRRVFVLASYGIDFDKTPANGTGSSVYIKPGTVSTGSGETVWLGGYIGPSVREWHSSFQPSSIHQVYCDPASGVLSVRIVAAASSGIFPAGSLALYELTTDSATRFSGISDFRPWTGTVTPLEVVSNSALRSSYGASFSFSEITSQNGSGYGLSIGAGQVRIGANTYTVYGGGGVGGDNGGLRFNVFLDLTRVAGNSQTVQGFINTSGQLSFLTAIDIAGNVKSGRATTIPAGVLPLFIAVFDAVGRISSLSDYRPA